MIRPALILVILMSYCRAVPCDDELLLLATSFAAKDQGAIHTLSLDTQTGQLTKSSTMTDIEHPFYLATSPDGRFVYSIHGRTFGGKEHEQVAAFRRDSASGKLIPLNRQSARGSAACYLAVDSTARCLLVANYATGSVGSFQIREDGTLSEMQSFIQHSGSSINPARQKEPHAHCFVIAPGDRFCFAADLGLDKILCYQLNRESAKLSSHSQPFVRTRPGAGPRHLVFHPTHDWMYVINELGNTVTHYDFRADQGLLIERASQTTLPEGHADVTHTADVRITPDGKYLYGTNRGHDSIAGFAISEDGSLKPLGNFSSHGKGPQNLLISPNGRWLLCANMPGNSISVFRIDKNSGNIKLEGSPLDVLSPSCLVPLP